MKGIMDGKKGILMPYGEVIERLGISKDYLLKWVDHHGEDIVIQLVKKEGFTVHGNSVDFDCQEKPERYIFLKEEDFKKKLGIAIDNLDVIFCFVEDKKIKKMRWNNAMDPFFLARELLGKENLVWIREGDPLEDTYLPMSFIEVEW